MPFNGKMSINKLQKGVKIMYCAKCGKEMDDSAKFCPSCGAETSGETVSEQPAAQQPIQQQPYSEPAYASAQPSEPSSGIAVGALICGIIGLVLCWVPIVGLILSIVAIVLGGKGKRTLPDGKRGMAVAGFILGIIGLVISIIVLIAWVVTIVILGSVASWALGAMM